MRNNKTDIRDCIIEAFLAHVPFDGWSRTSLLAGTIGAGYEPEMMHLAFPGGMMAVAEHFSDWSDRRMLAALEKTDCETLKIRERIHLGIKTRLALNAPYREAVRRLLSFMALPGNAPAAAQMAWKTSSVIWYWAGDRSADWNHYSKRGLLASVYTSSILYWLADVPDDNGDFPETWAFVERRIGDVLTIFGLPSRLKKAFSSRRKVFSLPSGSCA